MKVLIIEDEARAANQLQAQLRSCNFEYELIDIIDTVEDSISWLKSNEMPDLIFLDIQLADGISFEIFQHVQIDCPIIFTTAFDQYAIQAFKVNSVDYLLKPIQKEDIQQALNKFSKTQNKPKVDNTVLQNLLSTINKKQREGILVKEGSGFVQLKINELIYVYSEDSITFGITKSKRYIIEETIESLFSTLDKDEFFKINRGQIIKKDTIRKIEPYFNHRVKLQIENAQKMEFIVSRQKTSEFKEWMNR